MNRVMNFINQLRVEKNLLKESLSFWHKLRRFNASTHTVDDVEKMQYVLLRQTHTLEKGMSMRNPRLGFGQAKALRLIDELIVYAKKYANVDREYLQYPINTLHTYIEYTKSHGTEIFEIEKKYNFLVGLSKLTPQKGKGGVLTLTKEEISEHLNTNFKDFLSSRHSIRFYKNCVPDRKKIDEALSMAQKTPSACNRQGWKTHVFLGEKSVDLIRWQGGARGFENEIKGAILVTANLKAFLFYEVHQAYVDGGLYAMNLINALHSLGFGTIPLSVGFDCKKNASLKKFLIPENEVPIVIIGFGELEDEFKVAISERKDICLTNTYH